MKINQKVNVDYSGLKKVKKRVKRLHKLLKEANSLADELASKDFKIVISEKYSD